MVCRGVCDSLRRLPRGVQVAQGAPFVVKLDRADDVPFADHIHALGDHKFRRDRYRLETELLGAVLLITVADGLTARPPAAAVVAAEERSVGFEETVVAV